VERGQLKLRLPERAERGVFRNELKATPGGEMHSREKGGTQCQALSKSKAPALFRKNAPPEDEGRDFSCGTKTFAAVRDLAKALISLSRENHYRVKGGGLPAVPLRKPGPFTSGRPAKK